MQLASSGLLGEKHSPTPPRLPPPGRKQLVMATSKQGEATGAVMAQNAGRRATVKNGSWRRESLWLLEGARTQRDTEGSPSSP